METRLKLILRQIHWSLALKAFILAVVWLFLPRWAFLVLSFYFYLVPVFHPGKLFLPFLVFLFLAFEGPTNPGFAVILGLLFYIILGIKDLILIDRRSAYDILVLVLMFVLYIRFFSGFGDSLGYLPVISIFLLSAVLCLLYGGFLSYGSGEGSSAGERGGSKVVLGLVWLLISQMSLAIIFLPLNFIYQSALAFFLSAIIFGLASAYLNGTVTRERILINFSVVFVFLVLILGSVQWGL